MGALSILYTVATVRSIKYVLAQTDSDPCDIHLIIKANISLIDFLYPNTS